MIKFRVYEILRINGRVTLFLTRGAIALLFFSLLLRLDDLLSLHNYIIFVLGIIFTFAFLWSDAGFRYLFYSKKEIEISEREITVRSANLVVKRILLTNVDYIKVEVTPSRIIIAIKEENQSDVKYEIAYNIIKRIFYTDYSLPSEYISLIAKLSQCSASEKLITR